MAKKRKTDSEPVKAAEETQATAAAAKRAPSAPQQESSATEPRGSAASTKKTSSVPASAETKETARAPKKLSPEKKPSQSAAAPEDAAALPPSVLRASSPIETTQPGSGNGTQSAADTQDDSDEIARIAYSYWEERGRQHGSADEDWFRAVEEYRRRKAERIHAVVA
jgi:hypothetical protein